MKCLIWVAVPALAGCVYGGGAPTGATSQHLEGSLGDITNFSANQFQYQQSPNGVRIDALGEYGWVMNTLSFSPPLSDSSWAPGTTRTYDLTAGVTTDTNVSVLGCSGPSYEHWTYDSTATRVTVHIDEASTSHNRIVSYTATWANGGSTVAGSFEYAIP